MADPDTPDTIEVVDLLGHKPSTANMELVRQALLRAIERGDFDFLACRAYKNEPLTPEEEARLKELAGDIHRLKHD